MRCAALILLVLAAIPLQGGKKNLYPTLVKKAPETADIAKLTVPKPKQACPNWAWAAAVQLMLEQQQVSDFKQEYWILKSAGGELCIEKPVDLDRLKQWIDADYVLMDGRHLHFEGVITPGAPQDVSHFIDLLKNKRTSMVLWRGRPMVLKAIEYDEYIYPNGQRMFEARKVTMIDPLAKDPVVFEKTKDDIDGFGGMFEVNVGPIDPFR